MSRLAATRRGVLAGGLALGLPLAAGAAVTAAPPEEMALGNPRAPVTMIEYASVGCPHCAHWAIDVFPAFKAKYVDTGKVRFVVRECLTGDQDVAAAGFLLARCAGPAKYFPVIDALYRGQGAMYTPGNTPGAVLRQVAHENGLSDAQFDACIGDAAALKALEARVDRWDKEDHVTSTPTFDINGKRYEGAQTLAQLDVAIAAAVKR